MLKFAVAFLIGILFINSRVELLPLYLLIVSAVLIPGIFLYVKPSWFLAIAGFCWGALWMCLTAQLIWQPLNNFYVNKDIEVEGRVLGIPKTNSRSQSVVFLVDRARLQAITISLPNKVLLVDYHGLNLEPGQKWRIKTRLKPLRGLRNARGFDLETWAFHRGLGAIAYVRSAESAHMIGQDFHINALRWNIAHTLADHIPSTLLGFAQALVVGDKQNISQQQWQALRHTGTNHLMAISGLHIGLVAASVYFLCFNLIRCVPNLCLLMPAARWAAACAMCAALAYAALAGFAIPTQRALIMITVVLWDLIRQRPSRPSRVLATSLLAILLWDPLASLSAGFYLSFAAVLCIYWVIHFRRQAKNWLFSLINIQWAVSLGLLPVLIWSFSQFSLVAPLVNLIVVPLVSFFVVPFLLIASLLLFVSESLAIMLFYPANYFLHWVWSIIEWSAQLPLAEIKLPSLTILPLVSLLIGCLLLLSPRGLPGRSIGLVFLLPVIFPSINGPSEDELWMTVLDVGQGLAIAVETKQHTLVYDTGPPMGKSDGAQSVILPHLQQYKRSHIDLLVVSHGDADHSAGTQSLVSALEVRRTWVGGGWNFPQAEDCILGKMLVLASLQIRVLGPEVGEAPGNNASCIIKLSFAEHGVLLTGDVEYEGEYPLMMQDVKAQVLLVPHHGSLTSSSEDFIQAVSPRLAVISSGYLNRFGHPHQQVIRRYLKKGIQLYDTAKEGAIRLIFRRGQKDIKVEFLWLPRRRYWHR